MLPLYTNRGLPYKATYFFLAVVETLLMSGIVFGWVNFIAIFKNESFFIDLCEGGELSCNAQNTRYNLVFLISTFFQGAMVFPAGFAIDRFGARNTRLVTGTIYLVASLSLAFVEKGVQWLLFPIFVIISSAGGVLMITVLQASNFILYEYRGFMGCMLAGCFDSSAIIPMVIKICYDHGIQFRSAILAYTLICLIISYVLSILFIPPVDVMEAWDRENVEKPAAVARDRFSSFSRSYGSVEYSSLNVGDAHGGEVKLIQSSEEPAGSFYKSLMSPLFLLELCFLSVFQLKLWYFAGSVDVTLDTVTHDPKTFSHYVDYFGYAQITGIAVNILGGLLFENNACKDSDPNASERKKGLKKCVFPFILTTAVGLTCCILSLFKSLKVQIPSYILYAITRGFLYGNHNAFIAAVFPPSHSGRLFGIALFTAGLFGCVEYALYEMTARLLHGDAFWTNTLMLILVGLFGCSQTINIWWNSRTSR